MSEALVWTVNEAAERLHVHPNTVYALCRTMQIPSVRVGRKVLISKVCLSRYLGEIENQGAVK